MSDGDHAVETFVELLGEIVKVSAAIGALKGGRGDAGTDADGPRRELEDQRARYMDAFEGAFESMAGDQPYAAAQQAGRKKGEVRVIKAELARRGGLADARGVEWHEIAARLPEPAWIDWLWTDVTPAIVAALSDRFGGAHPLLERHLGRWYPKGGNAGPLVDMLLSVPGRLTAVLADLDGEQRDALVALLLAYVNEPPQAQLADGLRGNLQARTEALRAIAAAAPYLADRSLSACQLEERMSWLLEQAHDSHFEYGASAARALGALASRVARVDAPELVAAARTSANALLESCEAIAVESPRHRSLVAGLCALLRWTEPSAVPSPAAVATTGTESAPSDIARRAQLLLAKWLTQLPKKETSDNQRYVQASAIYGLPDAPLAQLPIGGGGAEALRSVLDELAAEPSSYVLAGLTDVLCEVAAAGERHPWAVAGIDPLARLVGLGEGLTGALAASRTTGDVVRLLESARLVVETLTLRAGTRLPELGGAEEAAGLDPVTRLARGEVVGEPHTSGAPTGDLLSLWVASCRARTARSLGEVEREACLEVVHTMLTAVAAGGRTAYVRPLATVLAAVHGPAALGTSLERLDDVEAALGSLADIDQGFLPHAHAHVAGLRVALLREVVAGFGAFAARAQSDREAGSRQVAGHRLDSARVRLLDLTTTLLHGFGVLPAEVRGSTMGQQALIHDLFREVTEPAPDLWDTLLRFGERDEPALVVHPAIARGFSDVVAHGAPDPKTIGDFADLCVRRLTSRGRSASEAARRLLDMLADPVLDTPLLERIAGRAAVPALRDLASRYLALEKGQPWKAVTGGGDYGAASELAWQLVEKLDGGEGSHLERLAALNGDFVAVLASAPPTTPLGGVLRQIAIAPPLVREAMHLDDHDGSGAGAIELLDGLFGTADGACVVQLEALVRGPLRVRLRGLLLTVRGEVGACRAALAELRASVPEHRRAGLLRVCQVVDPSTRPRLALHETYGLPLASGSPSEQEELEALCGRVGKVAEWAQRLCRAAGWSDLETVWADVHGHPLVTQPDDVGVKQLALLPAHGAIERLRALADLGDAVERATQELSLALGPQLGAPGNAVLQPLRRELAAPYSVVQPLREDPSPPVAREVFKRQRTAPATVGGWMARRLGYEVLVRGFSHVEALKLAATADKSLLGWVRTVARWLYSLPVQAIGAGAMILAVVLAAMQGPVAVAVSTAPLPPTPPACTVDVATWWGALLLLPVVAALLPALVLLLFGLPAERRAPNSIPLLAGRLFFPRLWAANALGVTFFAMSDEGWENALSGGTAGKATVVLFAVLALGYLILEVQRASASPRPRPGQGAGSTVRALRLWLTALNQATLLVVAIQLYLGPVMRHRAVESLDPTLLANCVTFGGGAIYPSAVLTWSFGGMFFGLLLQALWEETPLSAGLD